MDRCPSTFALDDLEIHAGEPATIAGHLRSCPSCQARTTRRDQLRARFQAQVADPLWRQVATTTRRRARRQVGVWAVSLAAAAVVLPAFWLGARHRAGVYVGVKGGVDAIPLALGRRQGRVFVIDAATPALPGDELQLTVRATKPVQRFVAVGSVDGSGRFSPFYPPSLDGQSIPLPPAGQPLSPPIVLDAAPGPERVVVALSAHPLSVRALAARAEADAPRLEAFAIPDDRDAQIHWVVVPKGRAPGSR